MTRWMSIVVVIAALAPAVLAQGGAAVPFERERNAEVAMPGQQRLDVDVTLLTGSQPFTVSAVGERFIAHGGLSDLRLFTSAGLEIPYLLVPPSSAVPTFIGGKVLPITAVDAPNQKSSGFEVISTSSIGS